MYYGLRLMMFNNDVSIDDIAKLLNAHRNTVSNKLNGKGGFKCEEICQIREAYFPNATLDELIRPKAA